MDPTPLGYFCNWTFAHILLCPLHLTQPRYLGAMGQRSVGAGQVPFWVDHMAEWLGWPPGKPELLVGLGRQRQRQRQWKTTE